MPIPDYLRRAASQWAASLILLLALVTIEFVWLRSTGDVRGNVALLLPVCWLNAAIGWLELGAPALLLCLPVAFISQAAARRTLAVLLLLFLLVQVLLTGYFAKASVPLGADLYGYSWAEIRQTVGAAGAPSWIAWVIGAAALAGVGWWLLQIGRQPGSRWLVVVVGLTGGTLLLTGWPGLSAGETEFTRNLVLDKTGFF